MKGTQDSQGNSCRCWRPANPNELGRSERQNLNLKIRLASHAQCCQHTHDNGNKFSSRI